MATISDNDLILYRYGDGLDAERIADIDVALRRLPDLRARYERLCELLDRAEPVAPSPPDDLEARLWRRLQPQLTPHAMPSRRAPRHHVARRQLAFAAAAMLLLAVVFVAGRLSVPVEPVVPPRNVQAPPPATVPESIGNKVLAAYVAGHLRSTEGLLLTAANSDAAGLRGGDAELARALVDSNRLYANAALRAGNARLADFLRQLEPVLLELANPDADPAIQSSDGLRDYLRNTDLLFQLRATQARMDAAGSHRT
jgi:hypothetical protein